MTQQKYVWPCLTMGTCYYPEQWPEELWESDLKRMKQAEITVIRVAEFAWSKFEPQESVFTFDFFDRFLTLCEQEHMRVIFSTPTATPPVWLTEKYPETLNASMDGTLFRHGGRRHYNYNSPVYRSFCAKIVEQLGQHYGSHPAIIGWQIDNELNCEVNEFYSEADDQAFRAFAMKKYETLDALNDAWGTVFWNQTYSDWSQVHIPRSNAIHAVNPHLHLDYLRFISESTLRFCDMQAQILRKYIRPSCFITTNGLFEHMDNHRMAQQSLDIYSYDCYPNFAFALNKTWNAQALNDREWSRKLTRVRSICPHFNIMEQQSGGNGWTNRMEAPAPRPGQLSLWAMQSIAHGADYISFFRWRTSVMGTEIYWRGILDYDNRDNRRLAEVRAFSEALKKLQPIAGASFTAAFGVLHDYENEWDAEIDVWHGRVHKQSIGAILAASQYAHTPYDEVWLHDDTPLDALTAYPALIYPHATIMNEKRAALLKDYVAQGGTLILGCRTGYKEETGKCIMLPQPGLLREIAGTEVREFTFASPAEETPSVDWNGEKLEVPVFADILDALDETKVLASFATGYFHGKAALTEHPYGNGRTLYWGGAFSREIVEKLLEYTEIKEPFLPFVEAPESVELILREKNGKRYLFALNYQPNAASIQLKVSAFSLLLQRQAKGEITLPPYGTDVFECVVCRE